MKATPDFISFDEWKQQFTTEEVLDMIDNNYIEGNRIKCPSCNGDGTVVLKHKYTGLDGTLTFDEYEVECTACDGSGYLTLDEIKESKLFNDGILRNLYDEQKKKDKIKYKAYYKQIKIK